MHNGMLPYLHGLYLQCFTSVVSVHKVIMEPFVQELLLFLLIGVVIACSRGSSLPGSCIAAGYSSCCTINDGSNCHGQPPTCFCDPSCREFQDCCADLDEICEPNLSPSEVLSSVKPVFLFATHTTFHSATLQWAISSFNHTLPDVNISYVVKYHQLTSSSTDSEMKVLTFSMENNIEYYMGDGLYGVVLSQLTPNTTYTSMVEVSVPGVPMSIGTNAVSFKTLEHSPIQELRIKLHNSTTVQLSWNPLVLPLGVQLSHYTLYYSFDDLEMSHQFGVHDACGMIGGLHVHKEYQFSVTATVVDVDGSVLESVRSTIVPVFLPDAVLFQLGGIYPHPCSNWNVYIEQQLMSTLQLESARAIRTYCQCSYPDSYIKDPLLFCHDDGLSSFTTFRAIALSTANMTTQILLNYLISWTSKEPVISIEDSGAVKLDSSCLTKPRLRSDPLCYPSQCVMRGNVNSQQSLRNTSLTETCISIPIFVATVAAELLLLLTVVLVGIIITVIKFTSRSKSISEDHSNSLEVSSTQRQAVQNTYEMSHISTVAPTTVTTETDLPITTTMDTNTPHVPIQSS